MDRLGSEWVFHGVLLCGFNLFHVIVMQIEQRPWTIDGHSA